MLNNLEPRAPLNLAEDLCDYSRNLLQNQLKVFPGGNEAINHMGGDGGGEDAAAAAQESGKMNERKRK